ncbi:MAG: hypothetical protein KY392_02645 [Chloroflexi bacterium]|nr:hypothetical protein [Chloroflexota bacterium]
MRARWWGRAIGPAIVTLLIAGSTASAAEAGIAALARWELVGRTSDGSVALRVPVPDGRFTLEYRNSLYGSPAAEHFVVADDGRLSLVGLGATDAAILQEYYAVSEAPRRAVAGAWAGWWQVPAATPVELSSLTVAASSHGERTLVLASGARIRLWEMVVPGDLRITLRARPGG